MTSRQVTRNSSSGNSISDGLDDAKLILAAPAREEGDAVDSSAGIIASQSSLSESVAEGAGPSTKLPRPTCPRIRPSASSSSYAAAIVVLFSPRRPANSLVGGSRSPRLNSREWIEDLIVSYT